MKKVAGIRPGGGKAANEFAELDAEDKAIAEYEEKKAQAGIPPGADHPGLGNVSHKDAAIAISKDKAKRDMIVTEMEDEQQQAEADVHGDDEAEEDAGDLEEEEEEEEGEAIPTKDIQWFRKHFRLRELHPQAVLEPWHLMKEAAEFELGIRHECIAGKGLIPRDKAGSRFVKKVLWRVYALKPDFLEGRSELERRAAVVEYIAGKAAQKDNTGHEQTDEERDRGDPLEPWHLARVLTDEEVEEYLAARKLRVLMSEEYSLSEPLLHLRDYLVFLVVFVLFVYTGRGDDKYWIKQTMDDYITFNEYAPTYNFAAITNTGQLYSWMNGLFLPVMFPQSTASGADLSCQRQQYMEDGTNLRVGNIRMRQIKVGRNVKKAWKEEYTGKYSTCDVPSMFEDATDRCFAPWGYKEKMTDYYANQYKKRWKGMRWNSDYDLETPSIYNSQTRHRFPGSGYAKTLANTYDEAWKDVDSLYRKTWIDVQTRAVFIEFTVLNAPSTFVVSGVLMLEYGAEGDVLPSAHYTVSSLYKSYLILATALQMFFADATSTYFFYLFAVLGAYVVLVLCNPWGRNMPKWAGGLSTRERKRRDAQEKRKREAAEKRGETVVDQEDRHLGWGFSLFSTVFGGLAIGYSAMAIYYSFTFGKAASDYLSPVLEATVYVMVFFQVIQEYYAMRQAKKAGDSYASYIFDAYNMIQFVNLGFFVLVFCFRFAALMEMRSKAPAFHDAMALPCVKGNTTDGSGWDEVPTGCYGTEEIAPTFTTLDDMTAEEVAEVDAAEADWKAGWYGGRYGPGEKYVDYGECWGVTRDKRLAAECCMSSPHGYVNLQMAMDYDEWCDQLTAFNALLLFLKFFRYVRMFKTLALFSETMKESTRRMVTITIIIGIIMTGFSMAFHLAFGFRDPAYRDFPESMKTLFEIILGDFDMSFIRVINPYLGPLFFYAFILVMIMVVLSMFVAIVDSAYTDVNEKMMHMQYTFIRDDCWKYCVTKRRAKVTREERRKLREEQERRAYIKNTVKAICWCLLAPCRCVYECCVFCKIVKPSNRWKSEAEVAAAEEAADEAASRAHSEAGNPAVFPPIPSPQRLFEELHLNRDFLLEPSVEQLT
jgi:hypothetical protein